MICGVYSECTFFDAIPVPDVTSAWLLTVCAYPIYWLPRATWTVRLPIRLCLRVRTYWALCRCCRLPRSTGSHVQRATAVSCFIIFPRMRSMAPCRLLPAAPSRLMVTSCLWKRQNMIRTAHIPHRKRPAIILLGRIMTHTGCRL